MTTIAILSFILWKGEKGLTYNNSFSVAHNLVNKLANFYFNTLSKVVYTYNFKRQIQTQKSVLPRHFFL